MAVFSLKQLLEAGGIFRISRTSDARPYGFDKVRMGTNLSGALRQLPLGRGAMGVAGLLVSFPGEGEPMSILVDAAADEFPDEGIVGHQALVDLAEELEGWQHCPQLLKTFDPLRHGTE